MIFVEIRNIVNEVKRDYPKMEQVSKNKLINSIPNRWLKVGLSSLVLSIIMKNHVLAISPSDFIIDDIDIAGGFPTPVSIPIQICNVACPITQIVSIVTFIITSLSILIIKMKSKKVKKWVKMIFIISIILFILSLITRFVVNAIY